ncbi:MAG: serine/threonine-protein kinase, partial [Planctomycetes bacterium]|nr:serine/threonine-protein kinase [Planctomycetota bacterium]
LHVALDAAEGLAALHAAGLCHRDVKPANLLFDHEGRIRLADFGLAVDEQQDEEIRPRAVAGTPCYMAPELFRGAIASPQTDLYGLGATLYHLVTGWPPHDAPDLEQLIYAIVNHPFPDPRAHAPWLDDDVAELILRLGAKRCQQRYATAQEVCEDTARLLRRSPPLHGLQTAGRGAAIAPAWSAYVYHDGEGDEALLAELRWQLQMELRPVEVGSLATATGATQPELIIYDVGHDRDSAVAWTQWMIRHIPHAKVVVILRRATPTILAALQATAARIVAQPEPLPSAIVEGVYSAISTASDLGAQPWRRPGFPPLPSVVEMALTRVVVLANRVDCGDPADAGRFARSCAALAGQLSGERQFYAQQLTLGMMHAVQDAKPEARERLRQALVRAARLLERTHRGCDLHWQRLDVLVVDDDACATLTVASLLQRHGASCRVAHGAEEGLRLAAQRMPQVVICDVAMPDCNGFQFTERLRHQPGGADCPVVFLTGMAGLVDFVSHPAQPHCEFIAKPVRSSELWLSCLTLLGEARWPRLALSAG